MRKKTDGDDSPKVFLRRMVKCKGKRWCYNLEFVSKI